jgi:hypothetical protein
MRGNAVHPLMESWRSLCILLAVGAWPCLGWAQGYIAPTNIPPGGLSASNTPQLVVITFDDEVTTARYALAQQLLTNRWNPNGSPIQATFFVSTDWGDYWAVEKLHAYGHEIAVHTMTHSTSSNTDLATWRAEIVGCRKALSELSGIPRDEIVGFRAPELMFNNESFQILEEQGFLYDASIIEQPGRPSEHGRCYIWPYTLDHGVAQLCATGVTPTNTFPGLFEIPMWDLLDTDGEAYTPMDPIGTYSRLTEIFRYSFTNRYHGNRAPLGLFLHMKWLTNTSNFSALSDFLTWMQGSYPDVWIVSMSDVAEFMRHPQDTTAAHTFPPFVTTTRALPPTNQVVHHSYYIDSFWSSAPRPFAYPRPDTIYGVAVPSYTGSLRVATTQLYATSYQATLVVSNTMDGDAIDWEAAFRISGGTVTTNYHGSVTTNGDLVILRPKSHHPPLTPGMKVTNVFAGTRTGTVEFSDLNLTLYRLAPRQPRILGCLPGTNETIGITWDDSSYGYRLETSGTLAPTNWSPVAEIHGRTNWTGAMPAHTGFHRLRTIP